MREPNPGRTAASAAASGGGITAGTSGSISGRSSASSSGRSRPGPSTGHGDALVAIGSDLAAPPPALPSPLRRPHAPTRPRLPRRLWTPPLPSWPIPPLLGCGPSTATAWRVRPAGCATPCSRRPGAPGPGRGPPGGSPRRRPPRPGGACASRPAPRPSGARRATGGSRPQPVAPPAPVAPRPSRRAHLVAARPSSAGAAPPGGG